jgi:hypothetical protein
MMPLLLVLFLLPSLLGLLLSLLLLLLLLVLQSSSSMGWIFGAYPPGNLLDLTTSGGGVTQLLGPDDVIALGVEIAHCGMWWGGCC